MVASVEIILMRRAGRFAFRLVLDMRGIVRTVVVVCVLLTLGFAVYDILAFQPAYGPIPAPQATSVISPAAG
jgi:hypothetical protein